MKITTFKDEMGSDGKSLHPLRCTCGLLEKYKIEELDEE